MGAPALDRLIENETYLDIFEQCLGAKASYCNAHLFLRSGPTDKRHPDNPWEGYHIDHYTNCLLPPYDQTGRFDYVNSGVYLHDVEDDGAPMLVIPGSHKVAGPAFVRALANGNAAGGSFKDLRQATELAAPVPSTGDGFILLVVPSPRGPTQRAWTLSMCRRDNDRWTRFANPFIYGERACCPFSRSPRPECAAHWPEPGHPYFTSQTLDLLEHTLPGIDTEPYRDNS